MRILVRRRRRRSGAGVAGPVPAYWRDQVSMRSWLIEISGRRSSGGCRWRERVTLVGDAGR
ncbi:hypothetical protein [Nonomuraea cavernae]|uniref:hypothetical protein n=1 Tax=Nonomuraea cavernae TaxID=2045107 RepID=UPI0033C04AF8